MEYKQLLEQRAAVANEMNNLTAEVKREDGRAFSPEELDKFDRMDSEFKSLSEKIETAKRIERSSEIVATPKEGVKSYRPTQQITRQDQDLAFKAWALKSAGKEGHISRRHTDAVHKCGVNLNSDSFTVQLADGNTEVSRNQSSGIGSEGGYLQNDGLFQGLERNLKWFGGARQVAKIIRTENGEPLSWAYSDDTANVGYLSGQNATVANTNVVYQKKTIGEYTAVTSVYPVSVQLLQDALISVSDDVGEVLGQRLARLMNPYYTKGTGASQPTGFITDSTVGATAAADTISYQDLVSLLFSVDKAYRDDPSFAFTMSDATMSALWKLEDANSRPLFWNQMSSLVDGGAMRILDKPVVINNDMDAPGVAGHKPVAAIVGNKFVIRDVKTASVLTLRERFLDQLAVGFIAYLRTDCKLLNSNCCKTLLLP